MIVAIEMEKMRGITAKKKNGQKSEQGGLSRPSQPRLLFFPTLFLFFFFFSFIFLIYFFGGRAVESDKIELNEARRDGRDKERGMVWLQ